ncbi:MAG: hypothetical protein ACREQY_09040 [Candidatus Binatia bacterium]
MILETMSNSMAALAALGTAERVIAAAALVMNLSALVSMRWLSGRRTGSGRDDEQADVRDAA